MTPRVVLLHGLAGSVHAWQPLVRELTGPCAVYVARLPWDATGSSDWAHDPDAAIRTIAASYRPGDVVVAHSYAATVLLGHLAGGAAPRPGGVVLVSPFYRQATRDFTWDTIQHYLVDFHEILAEGVRAASRRQIADDLLLDMAITVRNRIGPYAWTRFFEAYLASPTLPVQNITQPVYVVHGRHDEAAPLDGAASLAGALPDGHLVELRDSAHFPMLDQPAEVRDVVLQAARAIGAIRSSALLEAMA